jgi:hypothetical protein
MSKHDIPAVKSVERRGSGTERNHRFADAKGLVQNRSRVSFGPDSGLFHLVCRECPAETLLDATERVAQEHAESHEDLNPNHRVAFEKIDGAVERRGCPRCGREILGISTTGPQTHHIQPCGHRVSRAFRADGGPTGAGRDR